MLWKRVGPHQMQRVGACHQVQSWRQDCRNPLPIKDGRPGGQPTVFESSSIKSHSDLISDRDKRYVSARQPSRSLNMLRPPIEITRFLGYCI